MKGKQYKMGVFLNNNKSNPISSNIIISNNDANDVICDLTTTTATATTDDDNNKPNIKKRVLPPSIVSNSKVDTFKQFRYHQPTGTSSSSSSNIDVNIVTGSVNDNIVTAVSTTSSKGSTNRIHRNIVDFSQQLNNNLIKSFSTKSNESQVSAAATATVMDDVTLSRSQMKVLNTILQRKSVFYTGAAGFIIYILYILFIYIYNKYP